MTRFKNNTYILLFVFLLLSCEKEPECTDFLSSWLMKPDNLRFLGCQSVEKRPAIVLEASYSIRGSDAKPVEDLLHRQFNMERLRFVCCGWEAKPTTYTDDSGSKYDISMYSHDEFRGSSRWEDFSEFRVTVGKYIVLP